MIRKRKIVLGLDEAGRGALAGPVVAAAVLASVKLRSQFKNIKDSKQLTEKKREEIYSLIVNHGKIKWGIGSINHKIIDKKNILEATKMAMRKAVKNLKEKPDLLIIDGNFKINSGFKEKSVIKADETIFSCMLAGILAKVTRDRIMRKMSSLYPDYDFKKNKGYGTLKHRQMIKKKGLSKIHRKSFKSL